MERALLLIDGLAMDGDGEQLELIYRIAHAATGRCGNPHKDWRKETKELEKALKEARVIDVVDITSHPLKRKKIKKNGFLKSNVKQ